MAATLKIDSAGRIVVPKAIRDRLGISSGTELEILASSEGILIRPRRQAARLVQEGKLLVYAGELPASFDPVQAVEDERDERIRELWSR